MRPPERGEKARCHGNGSGRGVEKKVGSTRKREEESKTQLIHEAIIAQKQREEVA